MNDADSHVIPLFGGSADDPWPPGSVGHNLIRAMRCFGYSRDQAEWVGREVERRTADLPPISVTFPASVDPAAMKAALGELNVQQERLTSAWALVLIQALVELLNATGDPAPEPGGGNRRAA